MSALRKGSRANVQNILQLWSHWVVLKAQDLLDVQATRALNNNTDHPMERGNDLQPLERTSFFQERSLAPVHKANFLHESACQTSSTCSKLRRAFSTHELRAHLDVQSETEEFLTAAYVHGYAVGYASLLPCGRASRAATCTVINEGSQPGGVGLQYVHRKGSQRRQGQQDFNDVAGGGRLSEEIPIISWLRMKW